MIDTDGDGNVDYSLAPETFYWKIGIIADKEYALNYNVYLTGSMEDTRDAGSYATNNAAVLYYNNYIENSCAIEAPVPKLPWEAANRITDYGNTHVAFAVLWTPTLIPDAVVIDYGLPVRISVLANDIALAGGTVVNSIAASLPSDVVLNSEAYEESQITKTASLPLAHGTAVIAGTGSIVYTPSNALMSAEDIFYYEVKVGAIFLYTKVTVYPAQNIYYEDTFFTFTPVGKTVDEFNGMFDLSPGAALIFRGIEEGKDENAILAAILEEYEIDEQTAKTDMEAFLDKLRSFGIIE